MPRFGNYATIAQDTNVKRYANCARLRPFAAFQEEKTVIKILFVCHGNICRSPMAEFVFNDLVKKLGLEKKYHADSAATSSEEIGNPVYPPVRQLLSQKGISTKGKSARRIRKSDYTEYDLLIGMDKYNIRNMKAFFDDKEGKIYSLLSFAGVDRDVQDPWYTDDFDTCYSDIILGIKALLKKLENE